MKLYVRFKKNGAPEVLTEEFYDQLVKQGIAKPYEWDLYTPEKKYVLPWIQYKESFMTLEEVKDRHISYILSKCRTLKDALMILDIPKSTYFDYAKKLKIANDKWLNGDISDE